MFFVEYSTGKGNFVMQKPTKEEAENFAKLVKSLKGLYFTRIREDKETVITETDKTAPTTFDNFKIDMG